MALWSPQTPCVEQASAAWPTGRATNLARQQRPDMWPGREHRSFRDLAAVAPRAGQDRHRRKSRRYGQAGRGHAPPPPSLAPRERTVAEYPAQDISWFGVRSAPDGGQVPQSRRDRVAGYAISRLGQPYDYPAWPAVLIRDYWGTDLSELYVFDPLASCSGLVAKAYHAAGLDLVNREVLNLVTPEDLNHESWRALAQWPCITGTGAAGAYRGSNAGQIRARGRGPGEHGRVRAEGIGGSASWPPGSPSAPS